MADTIIIPEPFGPVYPDLGAGVAKYRRKANYVGSLREMLPGDRRAYGEAVEKAILAKQRAELQSFCTRAVAPSRAEPIGKARLAWLNGQLLAYPAKERAKRTEQELRAMYAHAMHEKRRASPPLAPLATESIFA